MDSKDLNELSPQPMNSRPPLLTQAAVTSRLPALLSLSTLAACAGAPPSATPAETTSATPASIPAEPVQPQADDTPRDVAPPPQEPGMEAKKSDVSGPKEPLPLKGSLTPVASAPVACSQVGVRGSLEELVKRCREGSKGVCGTLTVKAAHDADDVEVSLDVTTQEGVEEFVQCATDEMKSVRWECAELGKDIKLPLGECRL